MKQLSSEVLHHLQEITESPDLSDTKYRCIKRIGTGGMGTVFLAEDTELQRQVALKILSFPEAGADLAPRMMREARVLARLEHPSIVPVHDVGILQDGRVYYVMKLVKGKRLDEFVDDQVPLPELLWIFQKICDAVAFAHTHGVIHRDLKPENIMVSDFGEVLVMDWGLAKALSSAEESVTSARLQQSAESDTQSGTIMGTPGYMSPEQANGEVEGIDKRSDVYALGSILHFILTGMAPSSTSVWKTRTPKLLKAICKKAISARKEDRYASAAELSVDVERFLNGLSVSSYQENTFEKVGRWLDRNKFVVSLVLVYVLVRFLIYFLTRP